MIKCNYINLKGVQYVGMKVVFLKQGLGLWEISQNKMFKPNFKKEKFYNIFLLLISLTFWFERFHVFIGF